MRVLITGGSEMLGSALTRIGRNEGFTILSPTRKEMDLENRDATFRYIEANLVDTDIESGLESTIDWYLSLEKRETTNGRLSAS